MKKINIRLKNRVGERHLTNENYWVTIIRYSNNKDCDVQFDNGVVVKGLCYIHIVKGRIVNPYHPSVYGIGYKGIGKYKSEIAGKPTKVYTTWNSMLERCYSEKFHKRQSTYRDVIVCDEWHNFQVYGNWFEENYKENFELDKDILKKGNKIYSPETCCFVPAEINTLLIKYSRTRGALPIGVIKYSKSFQARIRKLGGNNSFGN